MQSCPSDTEREMAMIRQKKFYGLTAIFVTFLFGACAIAFQQAAASITQNPDISVNESGETYGVPFSTNNGTLSFPDLVSVEATNGAHGYMRVSEMNARVDEANSAIPVPELFAQSANDYYHAALFDEQGGIDLYEIAAYEGNYTEPDTVVFADKISQSLANALRNGTLPADVAAEVISDSLSAGTMDEAKAATISEAIGLAGYGTIREVQQNAASSAANALSSIEASELFVPDTVFETICSNAREMSAVAIPVYAEDGTTVVGEYEIARI